MSPFNEAKLKASLKGLEITIRSFKNLFINNPTFRIDSEYFKNEFLSLNKNLLSNKTEKLEALTSILTQGPNPKFSEGEIPCLTGRNINRGRVNYNNSDYVSKNEYNKLKRFQLKPGDTLITLKGKGSIGKIGYVTDGRKAIFSRDIGVIRPHNINSAYINSFIRSKYGSKIIERGETGGTGQSTLTINYLKYLDVPRLNIENEIGQLVISSEEYLQSSYQSFSQAEKLLLTALGERNNQKTKFYNVKSFSSSFLETGRLDAEYYQEKYEYYFKLITSYSNGFASVSSLCNIKYDNFFPLKNINYKYIELSNIGSSGEILDCTVSLGQELPTRARRKVKSDDLLVSSIEGSLESCALITPEYNDSLCSTGFFVINSSKINTETLLVLFKSDPILNLMKRGCSGTILCAINKSVFEQIPIPLIDFEIQKEIKVAINNSFELRKKSEELLNLSKQAVEIALSANEENALKFIKGKS